MVRYLYLRPLLHHVANITTGSDQAGGFKALKQRSAVRIAATSDMSGI